MPYVFSTYHHPGENIPYFHGRRPVTSKVVEDCVLVFNIQGQMSVEVLSNGVWDKSIPLKVSNLPRAIQRADHLAKAEAMR